MPDYARRSARVFVIDEAGRVLLLQSLLSSSQPELGSCWLTPGGGVDGGETLAEAAARELHEEIGLSVSPAELGRPVAFTSGRADFTWLSGIFRDDFFQLRVAGHVVDSSRRVEYERQALIGEAWWTAEEIDVTEQRVYPFGLADLLRRLVKSDIPDAPVELPWHH